MSYGCHIPYGKSDSTWLLSLSHKRPYSFCLVLRCPLWEESRCVATVSNHMERPWLGSSWEPWLSPSSASSQPGTTHGSEESSGRWPHPAIGVFPAEAQTSWSRDKPPTVAIRIPDPQKPWAQRNGYCFMPPNLQCLLHNHNYSNNHCNTVISNFCKNLKVGRWVWEQRWIAPCYVVEPRFKPESVSKVCVLSMCHAAFVQGGVMTTEKYLRNVCHRDKKISSMWYLMLNTTPRISMRRLRGFNIDSATWQLHGMASSPSPHFSPVNYHPRRWDIAWDHACLWSLLEALWG